MKKRKPKKPTINQIVEVVGNLVRETQILHQKTETIMMSLNYYIEYKKDIKGFTKFAEDISQKAQEKLKEDERNKPIKTSYKTDNKSDSKEKSVGSVSKSSAT